MAKVILVQENKDIHIMLKHLMSVSGTDLTKVCNEHGLDSIKTAATLVNKKIEIEFLKGLVHMINPEAELSVDVSISLFANGKEIFNQTTEK